MRCVLVMGFLVFLTACGKQGGQPLADTNSQETPQVATQATEKSQAVIDTVVQKASEHSDTFKMSTQFVDIIALQRAMQKTGIQQDDGIKWQQRLAQAKSEQEAKVVIQEQINALTTMIHELQRLKLHSQEVKSIQNELIAGANKMLTAEKELLTIDLQNPNNVRLNIINQEVITGGQMLMQANDGLIKLVQSLGFSTDAEAQAYYEHYKQQFEQFKHNSQ